MKPDRVLPLFAAVPPSVERAIERAGNRVATPRPYRVDAAAQALHARLFVADLHADTLLSACDPRVASADGHVDLPRLRAGNVKLQVFSIVTNMPLCVRHARCGEASDLVAALIAAQRWPRATWHSYHARALYQAEKLRTVAADPSAGLVLLRTREALARLLAQPLESRPIGAVLAAEGAQAVGDDVAGVDRLADAGVRLLGLAHFFDNAVAGSAHGRRAGGITSFGWEVLRRARARGMIVDPAHVSPEAIAQYVAGADATPFVVSHTGLRATCDTGRNLSDVQVREIVRAGGVIGIGAWHGALRTPRRASAAGYATRIVRTIQTAVALAEQERPGHGDEHVALGSDFDGWVKVGFDASGWPLLTEALMRAGVAEDAIARIMGGNVCRLLLRGLPGDAAP
jgi:membrane dipeptidase